jgi:hypothetical protein
VAYRVAERKLSLGVSVGDGTESIRERRALIGGGKRGGALVAGDAPLGAAEEMAPGRCPASLPTPDDPCDVRRRHCSNPVHAKTHYVRTCNFCVKLDIVLEGYLRDAPASAAGPMPAPRFPSSIGICQVEP